jgi:catechol 2,3-dioxygenase
MVQTGRDATRAYFKGWDERDHNSLILRDAGEAGMDFFGFKVPTMRRSTRWKPTSRTTASPPNASLRATCWRPASGCASRSPRATRSSCTRRRRTSATALGYFNPPPWNAASEVGIAPIRMDHALIYGPDIEKVQALFVDVLGFYLVEHILLEDGVTDLAIWLSCSTKAHDIALVRNEEPGKLHHTAFLLESWEKVLRAADIMSMNKVPIDMGPTRHGVTRGTTIYAFDPSGNRFETFCGGYQSYPDWEPITWTWDEVGPAVFYHDRQLNPAFLSVYT